MKKAVLVKHADLIPGVRQSFFKPETPMSYVAGQYCEVLLPDVADDPRGPGRTFTLASVPGDELVSFIYRYDEPASPYKEILANLPSGAIVKLGDAMGDLVLPRLPSIPLIFVAGGIGMASFTAILEELVRTNEQRNVHLLYSLRSRYDDAFRSQIDTFPFASKQRFIRPHRLSGKDILKVSSSDSLIYLSGSERFVAELRDQLHAQGLSHQQIIFDFFDGYADL